MRAVFSNCQLWAVMMLCLTVLPVHSATQGQWGRTSTATVKITLNIPARDASADSPEIRTGVDAFTNYCNQTGARSTLNQSTYQFQLLGSTSNIDLEQAMDSACFGRALTQQIPPTEDRNSTTVVLVLPI